MKYLFWLLLVISLNAEADQKFGDWIFRDALENIQVANSTNSSNNTAGIICFLKTGNCSAYLATDAACESGADYPMMINSSIGSFSINSTCTEIAGSKFLVINQFAESKAAFESGGIVGFVLPMESGNFKVMRFSTKGATAAIGRAMTISEKDKVSTKDEML